MPIKLLISFAWQKLFTIIWQKSDLKSAIHTKTADEKQEKTEKRKANLQTCKTCSISTPTHVRVHYNATK